MTDKTEAMDLAKTLYELSAKATQGEWISIQSSINPDRHYITNEHHAIFASEIGGTKPADLKFVTSLVNLYRTGKLVVVPDDAVERMARALAVADGIEICSDAIYALSSYGHRATAALASLKGADHAG